MWRLIGVNKLKIEIKLKLQRIEISIASLATWDFRGQEFSISLEDFFVNSFFFLKYLFF